jgi:hypothetical protein
MALRVAAFQSAYTEDLAEAVGALHDGFRWCDDHGVDIACFPECFLGRAVHDVRLKPTAS